MRKKLKTRFFSKAAKKQGGDEKRKNSIWRKISSENLAARQKIEHDKKLDWFFFQRICFNMCVKKVF